MHDGWSKGGGGVNSSIVPCYYTVPIPQHLGGTTPNIVRIKLVNVTMLFYTLRYPVKFLPNKSSLNSLLASFFHCSISRSMALLTRSWALASSSRKHVHAITVTSEGNQDRLFDVEWPWQEKTTTFSTEKLPSECAIGWTQPERIVDVSHYRQLT